MGTTATSAASTENSSALQTITTSMFESPSTFLFVLNNNLQFLASLIAYLQGGSGPITLKNTVTAPGFYDQDDSIPTNDDALLTYGAALQLFGSSKQLSNTALTTNPVPPSTGGGTAAAGNLIQEVTAVHGTTTAIPATYAPAVGSFLLVVVTQDSTGGGQITWNALFKYAIVNIGILPNDVNLFLFFGRTDPVDSIIKWFMLSSLIGQQ